MALIFGIGGRPAPRTARFPAARLADGIFTASGAAHTRGIQQSISRVLSSNGTVVAIGSQTGGRLARAQFFVSTDQGATWHVAPVSAAGGGEPPPGHAPRLLAGGNGAWLALGSDAIWTSSNGRSWVLAATHGIAPQLPGDQVWTLTRTATGFLAAGTNGSPGGQPVSAVTWTSADGLTWQRHDARRFAAPAGVSPALIYFAVARGNDTAIAALVLKRQTVNGHLTATRSFGVWHSADGGATWAPAALPVDNGAADQLSGLAAGRSAFLAVRPGHSQQTGDYAVEYMSRNGSGWRYAGRVTAQAGLRPVLVKGSAQGFVLIGQTRSGGLLALVSPDGRSWHRAGVLGSAATETLTSATVTAGGTAIAVGASTGDAASEQAVLTLAGGFEHGVTNVDVSALPHASATQVAVDAVAVSQATQVAVGSASGYPAIWSQHAGGRWVRASGPAPSVLARPGVQALTDVVHGPAGWVAVGGVTAGAPQHPVVVTSADGRSWNAADGEVAFTQPGTYTGRAAAGHSGYVVVGIQATGRTTIAAAWWSTGLTGWQRAADAAGGDLDGHDAARQMLAVTAQPAGFVAVGSHGDSPAAWTSGDGRAWLLSDLPLPHGARSAVLTNVAQSGGRVVAAGSATGPSGPAPFAAVSVDGGKTWQETALPAPGPPVSVTALTAAGHGFLAAGTFGAPGNEDVVIWSSANGRTWRAAKPAGIGMNGPGTQAITALAASGSRVTGAGYTATPAGESPTLWHAGLRQALLG